MKILYSCLSKSWGGMEMYTLTSVRQLLKRNIDCRLFCTEESRMHIEARNLGTVIYPIKSSGYFHPLSIMKIASILKKEKFDLIHTQASKDLWFLVPALQLTGNKIPLFLTKHVGSFIVKRDRFHRILYRRVTLAFAISRVIKKNLSETTPLTEDKIILFPNAVETKVFNPEIVDCKKVREEFSIDKKEIVIGMLARFSPGKGHEEFIEAARNLNIQHHNLKYIIVGEPSRGEDEYAENIKNLVKEYNLKNLIFAGFRKDIPEILAAMDIFVFPSHAEAFGLALIEAMAMGKPSVCSNSDGVLDIAVEGETSLFFEKKSSIDLQRKIEILINSPEKREAMGLNARKRIVEEFDIEGITDKIIGIYRSYTKDKIESKL
jgi:glycosyltransferase involved in cell wall biosynthesis